jgi:CO dehydrogenase maturation factor
MLRKIIETLSSNYDFIVIDTEAGLEHLSRRTTQNVNIMLVVSDISKRGLLTAQRIGKLSSELDINFQKIFLILNRVKQENEDLIRKKAVETGLDVIGVIYDDAEVTEYDIEGKSLITLPVDSNPVKTISKIVSQILN